MLALYPYQVQAEDELRAGFRRGLQRQILALPTGAGKTIVSADMIVRALKRGRTALFLAPRSQVVGQTWQKLTGEAGLDPERVSVVMGRDKRWRSGAPVSVACADSLAGRDLAAAPGLIIVDECHIGLPRWRPIVERWPEARVVGLSATPSAGMGAFFGAVVAPIGVRELQALDRLARAVCYSVPVNSQPDLRQVPLGTDGDFAPRPLAQAVDRPVITGDAVGHWRRLAGGRPTVAFCVSIAHAESVAAAFSAAGIPAACLHSKMTTDQRAEVLQRFEAGEVRVLSSCDCLSEGFDFPPAKCALLLRPTESLEKYLQQVGRVIRWHLGQVAVVIDHVGNVRRHGPPDWPIEWTLEGGKRREPPPTLTQCPACWATFPPAPACPVCGHTRLPKPGRQLRVVAGELVEVDEKPTVRSEPTREQYRAQLVRQAHAAGFPTPMREAFIRKRMAARFPDAR